MQGDQESRWIRRVGAVAVFAVAMAGLMLPLTPAAAQSRINLDPQDSILGFPPSYYGFYAPYSYGYVYAPYVYAPGPYVYGPGPYVYLPY